MEQYLAIGLAMRVVASVQDARDFVGVSDLRAVIQQFLPDLGIFDVLSVPRNPRQLQMVLRQDLWEKQLPELLADVYPLLDRYASDQHTRVLEELRRIPPSRWLSLATHGSVTFSCFKWERPFPEFGSPGFPFRPRIRLNFDMLRLFCEGRMMAECWRQSFRFLQHCMHRCFSQHELAKSLRLYFTNSNGNITVTPAPSAALNPIALVTRPQSTHWRQLRAANPPHPCSASSV